MSETVRVSGTMHTRAAFVPSTFNKERGTVEVTWTTGARGLRSPWFGERYYEELEVSERAVDLSRLNNGAPLLNAHDGYSLQGVIGVVERAWIANGEGRALVRFSDREEVKPIRDDVENGIIRHLSTGYSVQKYEKVEGGDDQIPVYRATRWTPAEISFVPMGFDDAAVARSARTPDVVEVPVETRGVEPQKESKMPEEQQRKTDAVTPPPVVDVEKVRAEERQRVAEISKLVERAGLKTEVATTLIVDGSTVDKAREVVLDAVMKRSAEGGPSEAPSGVGIQVTRSEQDTQRAQASAWLIERTGFTSMVEQAKNKPVFARSFKGEVLADPGAMRGFSLLDMARAYLERQKVNTSGMTRMELAGRALSFRSSGPYQGTDSFPVLFEDGLRKILLAAYATQSDTWRLFCGTDTVPDFRPSNRYRAGVMGGTLDTLNEHGEFKNKAIPDGSKTAIQTETRGNIIALTRQAIINDDMGALANLAANFGRLAGRTIESDVYALLAENSGLGPTLGDGNPFFHTSRGNVGTGSALTVDGLNADIVLMGSQKDQSGADYIQLDPQTLLVPLTLRAQANILNSSEFDPKDNSFRKPNSVRGMFSQVVGTPRLSGTRRYLFANPAGGAEAIKVVFLEGSGEGPVMEMEEGFRTDGTEWRIRMDMNVEPFDPKGAVTNAGA